MSRAVLQVFENYQAARTTFVQTVAELAHRPQNIEALQNAGVMSLLRPLLLDTVPSIQQSAALALGRLANYSEALAEVRRAGRRPRGASRGGEERGGEKEVGRGSRSGWRATRAFAGRGDERGAAAAHLLAVGSEPLLQEDGRLCAQGVSEESARAR
jgi:hypothetical protein